MLPIVYTVIGVLLAAFSLGLYVAVSLGVTAISIAWFFSDRPLWSAFGQVSYNVATTSTVVAVPLFILMGELLSRSGITDAMYRTIAKWLDRTPGGLLHANLLASGAFAAISGSSVATAATIGSVAIPAMRDNNYNERLALGSIAAGGTLGILIPPSIIFIVYGLLVEESIGKLYMAGIVPGIIMLLAFMAVVGIYAVVRPNMAPRGIFGEITWREKIVGLVALLPVLFLILVVLGTIYLGIATATEAAAFGTTGAFLLALLSGRMNRKMLREAFLATAATTSMIVFILIGAFLLQFVLTILGIPNALSEWIIDLGLSPMQFILLLCVFYFFLGMFLESFAMVVTTVPVFLPLLKAMGIDLVWFGVIMVILIELSLITPPVGMNLFVLQGMRAKEAGGTGRGAISDVYWGSVPFVFAMIAVLILVIAFPELSLWLPGATY